MNLATGAKLIRAAREDNQPVYWGTVPKNRPVSWLCAITVQRSDQKYLYASVAQNTPFFRVLASLEIVCSLWRLVSACYIPPHLAARHSHIA
jgi:hypothetical protein